LCFGFVQITITVPFLRIKRHFVQIFFTEERTFIKIENKIFLYEYFIRFL
jgi:hypothetical protein